MKSSQISMQVLPVAGGLNRLFLLVFWAVMLTGCAGNLVAVVPGDALGQAGPDLALKDAAFIFEMESQSCAEAAADKDWRQRVRAARKILDLPLRQSCREIMDEQGVSSTILRYGGKIILDRTDDGQLAKVDRPVLLTGGDQPLLGLVMPRIFRDRLLKWADGDPGFQFPAPFAITLLIRIEEGRSLKARLVGVENIEAGVGLGSYGLGPAVPSKAGDVIIQEAEPGLTHVFAPGYTALSVSPLVIWRALRNADVPVPILEYPDEKAEAGERP